MTVTGPVPLDQLGMTLMHEHFTFAYPGLSISKSLLEKSFYICISAFYDDLTCISAPFVQKLEFCCIE
jgi:predicted metal-dependent phosphotriesterase family hydrolase